MKYRNWFWECLLFLLYVGVEVTIGSNLGELLKTDVFGSITGPSLAPCLYVLGKFNDWSLGWYITVLTHHQLKKILLIVVPYIAFGWYWR
jgi:FHS family L-fucose permease-like MFS transporter